MERLLENPSIEVISARQIQVIRVEGKTMGTPDDKPRSVVQFWDTDGCLLVTTTLDELIANAKSSFRKNRTLFSKRGKT